MKRKRKPMVWDPAKMAEATREREMAALPLARPEYCTCGCTRLMHNGPKGERGCMLHLDCPAFTPRTEEP